MIQAFRQAGADPTVDTRLSLLLAEVGLTDVDGFGLQQYLPADDPAGPALLAGVVNTLAPVIIAAGLATEEQLALDSLQARLSHELQANRAIGLLPALAGGWGPQAARNPTRPVSAQRRNDKYPAAASRLAERCTPQNTAAKGRPVVTQIDSMTRQEVLARVAALAPELRARAAEGEDNRTMPADLAAKVKEAGLFRMSLPTALGGWEADPVTIFEAIERLSHADGSGGWTVLIGSSPMFMAWLDPAVAAKLLDGNPNICSTGVFAPLGRAVPDGTGSFKVDGRWPCNSGCPHSEWFVTGVIVMDGDGPRIVPPGRPDWRLAWFPSTAGEIIDNWHAAGLRGTGSHDVAARGITIPEELTCSPMFDSPRHQGPLYRLSFFNLVSVHMAGFSAGVGRRALDEFVAAAQAKHRGPSPTSVADDPIVQHRFALVDGDLQAARAFFIDAVCDAWQTVCGGTPCSLEQRARVMSANQALQRAALAAVDAMLPLAGASAVYTDNPLQRCSRDLHAAAQHIFYSADVLKDIGQVAFGRTPVGARF